MLFVRLGSVKLGRIGEEAEIADGARNIDVARGKYRLSGVQTLGLREFL